MKKFLLSTVVLSQLAGISFANEYTIKFDGDNDMYGLTRQTTVNVNTLEFVPDFSFVESGIDFKIENTAETGKGFALVNDGENKAGLLVYSGIAAPTYENPKITLTVPGGNISAVKFVMSGDSNSAGLVSLALNFNGSEIDSEKDGNIYYWNWKNDDGVETVTIEWNNTFYSRYIRTISLTYTQDLGGKEECGLAFSETSTTGFIGEAFTSPALENPYNLPLTWSSSNAEVATVDVNGNVTMVAPGKTAITVETIGNDKYAAGNASYELQVIPVASDIPQLLEYAPEIYDKVKVNFPMTVTFPYNSYAYVLDSEGNAGYIYDTKNNNNTSTSTTTIYKVGDVIPAGWVATNATVYSSVVWEGLPAKVEETVEVVYPTVESITPADVNRILILRDVTFDSTTPVENAKGFGTTSDGTTYEFQNTLGINSKPAGIYNVTCAVKYALMGDKEYFYLVPINYDEFVKISDVPENNEEVRFFDLNGHEVSEPHDNIFIKVANGKSTKIIVN